MTSFYGVHSNDSTEVAQKRAEIKRLLPREIKLDTKDQAFVDGGKDNEAKAARATLLDWVITMNGLAAGLNPGAQKSYIPVKNYYQRVEGLPMGIGQLIEMSLNWAALGKNKAALYGAAIRWGARTLMNDARETTVHDYKTASLSLEHEGLVTEYADASRGRMDQIAFWTANAFNVVALAGALQMSIGHHYDAKNTKPQAALIGALGQSEDVSEEDIRPMFYLAVHPVTLANIEKLRVIAASPDSPGFSEAVRLRALGVPAGFASLNIAVAAIDAMRMEPFYGRIASRYGDEIKTAYEFIDLIKANPTAFHVNAADYGVQKRSVDERKVLVAKIIGIAYARAIIGGTLAKAASIKKFVDAHSKEIRTWSDAFSADAETRRASIEALTS